jgi:hypothetical protein
MKKRAAITRRQFVSGLGTLAASSLVGSRTVRAQSFPVHVYIARNGTPVTNVQQAIALAGGIQSFVGHDDAVVLNPNGQWPLQGYTHTECMKALIDVILDRPGGFGGEIVIAEHVHRSPADALSGSYCRNMSAGYNRTNNWPDMNYFELVADYNARGVTNVTAIPLYDTGQGGFVAVTAPGDLTGVQHGDEDNHLRQALLGCNGKGVGTVNEADMQVNVWDAMRRPAGLRVGLHAR